MILSTFVDARGRDWSCRLADADLARIGVELPAGFWPFVGRLTTDPEFAAVSVWGVIESQARARGVGPDDFAAAVVGQVSERAIEALAAGAAGWCERNGCDPGFVAEVRLRCRAGFDAVSALRESESRPMPT